jgi:hypothetical protein
LLPQAAASTSSPVAGALRSRDIARIDGVRGRI